MGQREAWNRDHGTEGDMEQRPWNRGRHGTETIEQREAWNRDHREKGRHGVFQMCILAIMNSTCGGGSRLVSA